MSSYEVIVTASISHTVEAESRDEAIMQTVEWVEKDYGKLGDKASYTTKKVGL